MVRLGALFGMALALAGVARPAQAQTCETTSAIERERCATLAAARTGDPRHCDVLDSDLGRETCYAAAARATGLGTRCGGMPAEGGRERCRTQAVMGDIERLAREVEAARLAAERRVAEEQLAAEAAQLDVLERTLREQEQLNDTLTDAIRAASEPGPSAGEVAAPGHSEEEASGAPPASTAPPSADVNRTAPSASSTTPSRTP